MIVTYTFHFCGIFLSGFSSVFFNTHGAAKSDKDQSITFTSLNLGLMIVGLLCSFMSILFLIILQCVISSWKKAIEQEPNQESSMNQLSCNRNVSSFFQTSNSTSQCNQVYFIQAPPEYDPPPPYELIQKHCVFTNRSIQDCV